MLLRDDPDARSAGARSASTPTGRVVSILDARSPRPPEGAVTLRMFTGIHVLEPALLDRLQPIFCDVIRDAYMPALRAGETIRGGDAGRLLRRALDARRATSPGTWRCCATRRCCAIRPARWPASTRRARVAAGARVVGPVPHRRRRGGRGGRRGRPRRGRRRRARASRPARALRRAVVWSGATATGDIADAVVTPTGVVAVEGT